MAIDMPPYHYVGAFESREALRSSAQPIGVLRLLTVFCETVEMLHGLGTL